MLGRRLRADRATTFVIKGRPFVDPVAALFQCATELDLVQAVIMIDALLTTADNYPGRWNEMPLFMPDDIAQRLAEWGRFPGCGTIRAALRHAREEVESPKETETRMLLVSNGLPEPVVQYEVRAGALLLGRCDLAYPELKIAIEYEGDGHRTGKKQWRTDIQRQRQLEAAGWIVIRLTQSDLDSPDLLVARVRAALATRRATH